MTPAEQKQFVREHLATMEQKLVHNIDNDAIPPEWGEFELRELIFDMARDARSLSRTGLNSGNAKMRAYREVLAFSPDLLYVKLIVEQIEARAASVYPDYASSREQLVKELLITELSSVVSEMFHN